MIRHIVSYLSMKDVLHLCIAKLFLPSFVNSPWFLKKINAYFAHLLGYSYSKSQNLFVICALYPVIVNNNFYLSVDHSKLPYFKKIFNGSNTVFTLHYLQDILKVWSILFQPYKKFKMLKTKKYLGIIQSFQNCHNLCPCLKYRQTTLPMSHL